jgi:hypothetical protein
MQNQSPAGLPDGIFGTFSNQKSQFGQILEGLTMEDAGIFYGRLVHFTAIWHANFVAFIVIWYIFPVCMTRSQSYELELQRQRCKNLQRN